MSKSRRYPVRVPRYATGIRMQETRGGARCWWARRWSEALEAMGLKGRMGRGRDYAVRGHYSHVVIMGGDELAAGTAKVKNLATREEATVALGDLAAYFN